MSDYRNWEEWEQAAGLRPPTPTTTFDKIDPAEHKKIARSGGLARHQKGTGHEFRRENRDAAAAAGRKGGLARARNRAAAGVQSPEKHSGGVDSTAGPTEK